MKKFIWSVFCGLMCIQLAGCAGWVTRTSVSTQPRVDQEIVGNRGFIFGKPTAPPKEPTFKDRKVYRLEIEIPSFSKRKEPRPAKKEPVAPSPEPEKEDKALWGNRGYIWKK